MATYEQIIALIEDSTTIDHNNDMVITDWEQLQAALFDLFNSKPEGDEQGSRDRAAEPHRYMST